MNKHYIRLDANNNITKGFSDAFEIAQQDDICICEDGGRHLELNGVINPALRDEDGCPNYKYINSEILELTNEEKTLWITENVVIKLTENEKIWSSIEYILGVEKREV